MLRFDCARRAGRNAEEEDDDRFGFLDDRLFFSPELWPEGRLFSCCAGRARLRSEEEAAAPLALILAEAVEEEVVVAVHMAFEAA